MVYRCALVFIVVKEFKLTFSSIGYFVQEITKLLTENPNKSFRLTVKVWRESRSLNQNSLQHVIYGEVSKYLISKGRDDWCTKTTKKNLKNKYLGWVSEEFTDVETGEITIKETLKHTSDLDVGDSYIYTTNILDFADNIGCEIKIPENCEYRILQEQQNN